MYFLEETRRRCYQKVLKFHHTRLAEVVKWVISNMRLEEKKTRIVERNVNIYHYIVYRMAKYTKRRHVRRTRNPKISVGGLT
jgi:hypothetical protein